jgi:hypothetical protein
MQTNTDVTTTTFAPSEMISDCIAAVYDEFEAESVAILVVEQLYRFLLWETDGDFEAADALLEVAAKTLALRKGLIGAEEACQMLQ